MKNRILLKTNLLVCAVILCGFLFSSFLLCRSYYIASKQNIEEVSILTSEDIYFQVTNTLTKPVDISLAMANDSLLKAFLAEEQNSADDPDFAGTIAEYLDTYQEKYQYDAVFLVSAGTEYYYNYNGMGQKLDPNGAEDAWYYDLIASSDEYNINIDSDHSAEADDEAKMFVNCKIYGEDGLLGVVGVGVRINDLQKMLQNYQERYGVSAYFVDDAGMIKISTEYTGKEGISFFDNGNYGGDLEDAILNWEKVDDAMIVWMETDNVRTHIVVRDLPAMKWHLIVEQDDEDLMKSMLNQILVELATVFVIAAIAQFIIAKVIRRFNQKIISMERAYEQERQTMFEKVTSGLFEDIYVLDITNNCPADKAAEEYFAGLGAPAGTSFDDCLRIIAEKQIKEEYRQGYIDMFSTSHVLKAFSENIETLKYDFMISDDGENYRWIRITARLVKSDLDGALLMHSYRQNIDAEKRREYKLKERASMDEMTGLLHKTATQHAIDETLLKDPESLYAFFIFDIDHFKEANDQFGHAFGDKVIRLVADTVRSCFRSGDLLGRIGGDEFAVLLKVPDMNQAESKAAQLNQMLGRDVADGDACWHMSVSIGVAFAPRDGATFKELYHSADSALYETKRGGRNGYSVVQQ